MVVDEINRRSSSIVVTHRSIAIMPLASAVAEMGPCRSPGGDVMLCGSGDGAAQTFYKTTSPSGRLAFAWRLTDRPPVVVPEENDPNLENIVVRIGDGAILAKSRGSYWSLGTKIAKAHVFAAWSPDSHWAVKVEQRAESSSAELFAFVGDDDVIGPIELAGIIKPALLSKIQAPKDAKYYNVVFSSRPPMTIDNQGLIRTVIYADDTEEESHGSTYEATVQVTRDTNTFEAKVVSLLPYASHSISIIVH